MTPNEQLKAAQQQVREFMLKAGQECPSKPMMAPLHVFRLRQKLHLEETIDEFTLSNVNDDIVGIADSLADSLVVILGTACAYGIDIAPVFEEVMRSNMTKFIDGHKREDGKWIKGPSYSPANLEPIIEQQQQC